LEDASVYIYAIKFQSVNLTLAGNELSFTFSFTLQERLSFVGNKNKA
jgi:hypothetical protein